MDENKLMMQFLSEELGTNDPKKIQNYLKGLDEQKQKALATKYQQWKEAKKKKQATKAAHGAKLNYIKTLKHICPEGQEVVYFKQGGNLQCGCKGKKMKEGAKVEKDSTGIVARFKSRKNVVVNGSTKQPMLNAMAKQEAERKARIERDRKSLEDYEKGFTDHGDNPPDSEAMAKNRTNKQSQGKGIRYKTMAMNEKGGSVVNKFKKAKCGSKMKKK